MRHHLLTFCLPVRAFLEGCGKSTLNKEFFVYYWKVFLNCYDKPICLKTHLVRREFEHKPNCFNKLTTVIVRRTFFSYEFSTYLPLMSIHFWQRSYHRPKAVANSWAEILLVTPFHSFLRLLWSKVTPASSSFMCQNKKKSSSAGGRGPRRCEQRANPGR